MESESELPESLFGIVTTGICWVFIHWTGSPEKPNIEFSRQYHCDFEGDLQSEKDVVSHIAHILKISVPELRNKSKRVRINKESCKDDNE